MGEGLSADEYTESPQPAQEPININKNINNTPDNEKLLVVNPYLFGTQQIQGQGRKTEAGWLVI